MYKSEHDATEITSKFKQVEKNNEQLSFCYEINLYIFISVVPPQSKIVMSSWHL